MISYLTRSLRYMILSNKYDIIHDIIYDIKNIIFSI